MDREQMIKRAAKFADSAQVNMNRDDIHAVMHEAMADFAISIINSKEFLDIQSVFAYEAGYREVEVEVAKAVKAERKRIAEKLRSMHYKEPFDVGPENCWICKFIKELEAE